MYKVPRTGLTLPAVAGRLERGVRQHAAPAQCVDLGHDLNLNLSSAGLDFAALRLACQATLL